jgi:hypothetical protein
MGGKSYVDELVSLNSVVTTATYNPVTGVGFLGLEGATGPRFICGDTDPSGAGGVAANLGTVYLRKLAGNVQVWQKTAALDTDWTQMGSISGGALSPTAISTIGTAAFQWTMADAQATAVSMGAAGALDMLVFDTTNGTEQLIVNAANGLRLNTNSELRFGTAGTLVNITGDGTDARVTGTGQFLFNNDVILGFGTSKAFATYFASGTNRMVGLGLDLIAGDHAATGSTAVYFKTGYVIGNTAAVQAPTGSYTFETGASDINNAGGTGSNTGGFFFVIGSASATLGTSGSTGGWTFTGATSVSGSSGNFAVTTGPAAAGTSGSIVLTTAAGSTRGVLDLNVGVVDLSTEATAFRIVDNNALAFVLGQSTNDYFKIDTTNDAEVMSFGNTMTNPAYLFAGAGRIQTDGIDHAERLVIVEDFRLRPQINASVANADANKNWELLGTNVVDACSTFDVGGGLRLTTTGAGNDQAIVWPHQDANQGIVNNTQWSTADRVKMKINVKVVNVLTVRLAFGWKLTTNLAQATDADECFVGFDTAAEYGAAGQTKFVLVTNVAGAGAVDQDTGVVVAAGSYRFVLDEQSNRTVNCYINGVLKASSAALTTPLTTLKPFAAIQTLAAAPESFCVQRLTLSKNYI